MKKTHKQIFGFAGLALVVAVTAFAATLPSPGASAAQNSITDTLQVRVVGSVPDVNFIAPEGNTTVSVPNQELKISYENVKEAVISLNYTNKNGTLYTIQNFATLDLDYQAGESTIPADLSHYGYGTFEFIVNGFGYDGVPDTDAIKITYIPVQGEIEEGDDGSVNVELEYDENEVGRIEIDVFPEGENDPVYETTVTPPTDSVEIPFDEFAKETGDYEIKISTYDKNGNLLYTTTLTYYYEVVPVPDTGAFFQNLDISKEDYLITGLMVFFVIAIVAFGVVAKSRKTRK